MYLGPLSTDPPHNIPLEHACTCRGCGQVFDMRDLDQVLVHKHLGPVEVTGIRGVQISPPTRKECPVCRSWISLEASRCAHCGEYVGEWYGAPTGCGCSWGYLLALVLVCGIPLLVCLGTLDLP